MTSVRSKGTCIFCVYVQNVHVSKRDITIYVVTIYHDTSRRYWEANCTRQPFAWRR